jgi:hypothetical protein
MGPLASHPLYRSVPAQRHLCAGVERRMTGFDTTFLSRASRPLALVIEKLDNLSISTADENDLAS